MRIACPSCASEYEVPASRLRPSTMVRCAGCGSEWLPAHEHPAHDSEEVAPPAEGDAPQDALAAEPVAALPDITAMDRLAAYAAPPSRRSGLTAAWLATIEWHHAIARVWPPSGRILGTDAPAQPPPAPITAKTPR